MTVIDPAQDWTSLSRLYAGAETLLKFGGFECEIATDRITWTPGAYDLFEVARGSHIERRRIVDLYEETSRANLEMLRAEAVRDGTGFSLDAQIHTTCGERRWIRLKAEVALAHGRPVRLFGTKQDITREKQAWDRLRLRAERDALTGLANRDAFEHRLRGALAGSEGLSALFIVDVDRFKSINDRLGHAVGDAVLTETAQRLSRLFADALAIARIGGDEFAVLLGASSDREAAGRVADRILASLRLPMRAGEAEVTLGASLGIAVPEEGVGAEALFARADLALYAAKAAGKDTVRAYAPDLADRP
jgi:diguanylate cyclase (GGDEF)-like protein